MSDTRALLSKIAALRERLEQVPGLTDAARQDGNPAENLDERVSDGRRRQALLDAALKQLSPDAPAEVRPVTLTARARTLLERGRQLVNRLRDIAADPHLAEANTPEEEPPADPLAAGLRETAAMAESALRLVSAFPDSPSTQLRLCEGLEGLLKVVAERVAGLDLALERRRVEALRVARLSGWLTDIADGCELGAAPFYALAEELLAEAEAGEALRFPRSAAATPADAAALHGLTVAAVVARLVPHDDTLRREPLPAVLAALVHDVGLLKVAPELLTQTDPLTDDQRRQLEQHPRVGAELIARHLEEMAHLTDAVQTHHERPDGTGYPAGLRGEKMSAIARLLAAADFYAALASPRPHRAALDSRAALTETLLAAERGHLDRRCAELLLGLTFYPVGTAVELSDGSVGLVVATHHTRRDLTTPARPVLALLTNSQGQPLPAARHLDLAMTPSASIVRSLPPEQRRQALGRRYPELVL